MAKAKLIDTWKQKSWYNLVSPKFLGEVKIAEVVATDEDHLLNRIIAIPLKEITHEIAHMYTTIRMRVEKIKDKNAYTKFIGHEASREYLSTLGRRNRELLRIILTEESKDGVKFTVKMLVVTAVSCSTPKRKAIYTAARAELKRMITETRFGDFIQEVLYNKIAPKIHAAVKKIAPIKRVEVYKSALFEVFDENEVVELDRQVKAREAATPKTDEGQQEAAPVEDEPSESASEEKTEAPDADIQEPAEEEPNATPA